MLQMLQLNLMGGGGGEAFSHYNWDERSDDKSVIQYPSGKRDVLFN